MWLKPRGYAEIVSPQEDVANLDRRQRVVLRDGVNGFDTFTCGHIGRVVHVAAGQRPEDIGGLCKVCMRLICPEEVGKPCRVIERRLEEAESKRTWRRWFAEATGR